MDFPFFNVTVYETFDTSENRKKLMNAASREIAFWLRERPDGELVLRTREGHLRVTALVPVKSEEEEVQWKGNFLRLTLKKQFVVKRIQVRTSKK
jgi:hypothetical protein